MEKFKSEVPANPEALLGEKVDLMEMLSRLSEEFICDKIIPNLLALQLTHGCSGNCSFCAESAPQLGGVFFVRIVANFR